MRLKSQAEAANTRAKIVSLEAHYEAARLRHSTNSPADQAILCSLQRMIDQMKEELAQFQRDYNVGRIVHESPAS